MSRLTGCDIPWFVLDNSQLAINALGEAVTALWFLGVTLQLLPKAIRAELIPSVVSHTFLSRQCTQAAADLFLRAGMLLVFHDARQLSFRGRPAFSSDDVSGKPAGLLHVLYST